MAIRRAHRPGGGFSIADSTVSAFEQIKHADEQGAYWLARELGKLLGYQEWRIFLGVIHEAMEVCRVQGGRTERTR
jgi:hypothetical protein